MGKPRAYWLSIGWVVATVTATGWVLSRTGGGTGFGDALLVGMVIGTVLTAVAARLWK